MNQTLIITSNNEIITFHGVYIIYRHINFFLIFVFLSKLTVAKRNIMIFLFVIQIMNFKRRGKNIH